MNIDCVEFCKALSDDTRQQILVMLLDREMCVSDIVHAFEISQPTISHHLGILKQFKLVTNIRRADLSEETGWIVLELEGDTNDIEQGIAWVTSKGVRVDPIEG